MPIEWHINREEPPDDSEIWRFMNLRKFRDLMANEELYFCRLDLFKNDDVNEGLPSDDYVRSVRGLVRYDLSDELEVNRVWALSRRGSGFEGADVMVENGSLRDLVAARVGRRVSLEPCRNPAESRQGWIFQRNLNLSL